MPGLRSRKSKLVAVAAIAIFVAMVWALAPSSKSLPDFRDYEAGPERKVAFITFMQPLIEAENEDIFSAQRKLRAIAEKSQPGWFDSRWLRSLADEYGIETRDVAVEVLLDELQLRVDVVPASLALAQAAKESGWGTSRFAREGNSLFGEWCYSAGCGIVPSQRSDELRHEVRSFPTPQHSVESYLRNINTHHSYEGFRAARQQLRETDQTLHGLDLAEELLSYSEREGAYVRDIKNLIIFNNLHNDQGIPGVPE